MAKRCLFFFVFLCVVGAVTPLWAQSHNFRLRSSDDLAKSFLVLQESVERLDQANAQWAEDNRVLEQNIQELKNRKPALDQDGELFAKDLAAWQGKTKKKGGAKVKGDDIADRLANANQEIAMKKEQLQLKQKQQKRVWERLAAAGAGQGENVKDLSDCLQEKEELTGRLQESRAQKAQLEQAVNYWTLLNGDPSVSLPKLMVKRDTLIKRRNALSGRSVRNPRKPISYQDLASQERIKKLDFEVKQLAQKRFESSKLLQTIEIQYNSNPSVSRSSDEKKIQASIVQLKKDNKLLKERLANLRFEMVSLDKRKARLEKEVRLSK